MGKKYARRAALLTKKSYPLAEAVALLPQVSTTTFDGTAEAHIRILADTTQADQIVRTTVSLPHGTGKSVRIAAFVPDDHIDAAKKAGASRAGNKDLIEEVSGGAIDFDVAIATPSMMKDLGKIAKILGPKGLMPSPKSGTVSNNIAEVIAALQKGRIECKMDKQGIIHVPFGKISFGADKLQENLSSLLTAINEAKPSGIKGVYIQSIAIAPSMGPSIRLQI
ncbi:50S ribosomal protein L1 [Candidatus Peregrinibacteria bacterium]|nr:50S ribosomal protein L1 [Candidatus Peregrinibacteria bacterium]